MTNYPPPAEQTFATPPPGKGPRWARRHPVITGLLAGFGAIILVLIIVGIAAGGKQPPTTKSAVSSSAPASSAPAPTSAALSASDQRFIADMRGQFGFTGAVTDQNIATYGQAVCQQRQSGGSQSSAEHVAKTTWTNMSGSATYKMTRLAESDLCASELPAIRWHTLASYSGSGQWNSAPFHLHPGNTRLRVSFSYSGNTLDGMADNFIADLVSSTDDLTIANDIAASGGKTINLYPDLSFGGSRDYHLEVQADGSWRFTIQQKY